MSPRSPRRNIARAPHCASKRLADWRGTFGHFWQQKMAVPSVPFIILLRSQKKSIVVQLRPLRAIANLSPPSPAPNAAELRVLAPQQGFVAALRSAPGLEVLRLQLLPRPILRSRRPSPTLEFTRPRAMLFARAPSSLRQSAEVAQWQSTAFVKRGLRVQIPPSASLLLCDPSTYG